MTGQDAANTAKAFDEALPLTGVVLTKADGERHSHEHPSQNQAHHGKPLAGTDDDSGGGGTTICHKPGTPAEKTMEVDASALDAHLGHGDTEGACP